MTEHNSLSLPTGAAARNLPSVKLWRIHLGAHKTATTHIQDTLAEIRPTLAEAGLDAIPNAAFRPLWGELLPRRRDPRRWLPGQGTGRRIETALAPLRLGPDKMLLSEENILGETHEVFGDTPYPDLASRLRVVTRVARDADLQLFLSIRRMDRFLGSAYAEALRFFKFEAPFEALSPRLAAAPPRWSEVIERLRRAAPGVPLTVWRYEDYAANTRDILTHLCGVDPGPLPEIPPPTRTQTPSDAAVRAAEQVGRSLGYEAHVAAVAQIYADAPAGPSAPPFQPFSDAETKGFEAAYEADCKALEKEGLLLRF